MHYSWAPYHAGLAKERANERASQRRSRHRVLAYRWRLPVDPPLHLPHDLSLLMDLSRLPAATWGGLLLSQVMMGDTVLTLRWVPWLAFTVVMEEIFFLKAHSINFACQLGCQRGGLSNSCLMLPVARWFLDFEVSVRFRVGFIKQHEKCKVQSLRVYPKTGMSGWPSFFCFIQWMCLVCVHLKF